MAKKNVEKVMYLVNDNANTAIAQIMSDGKVDVEIDNHQNVYVIRHFGSEEEMLEEMTALGYTYNK